MSSSLQSWALLAQTRWRKGRRMFDGRKLNERRLLIVTVCALIWFVLDSAWITPSYKGFQAAQLRNKLAVDARDALQASASRRKADMALKEADAHQEVNRIHDRIARSKQALADQQAMLAPAREMRSLMEGLLAQNGHLRLRSMRTLPPEEVKFTPIPGVSISQTMLYKQGMEVSVEGSYMELLTWLRSLEELPRKLLWDGLTLKTDELSHLTLTLTVHTFSPDRDALEIAP